MKPHFYQQPTAALTRVEVMTVIIVLVILAVVLFQALHSSYSNMRDMRSEAQRINCINNLKQIGVAFRLWEGNHNDKFPMQVSVTKGGAMELVGAGNVAACFRMMSNELSTPKILFCPADTRRIWATNFSTGFDNSHVSYFVGLDAAENYPQMFLSGDDNFAIGGIPVKSGGLQLLTNTPVTWTKARHKFAGIIGLADTSVEQLTTDGLQQALQQTGVATNRLTIP
jgi:hypothetical protein